MILSETAAETGERQGQQFPDILRQEVIDAIAFFLRPQHLLWGAEPGGVPELCFYWIAGQRFVIEDGESAPQLDPVLLVFR